MTPVSELMRPSKNLPLGRLVLQSIIPRSQSDTSYSSLASTMDKRPRRASDWSGTKNITPVKSQEDQAVVLRPLQLNNIDQLDEVEKNSLLHRRLSRGFTSSKSPSSNGSMTTTNIKLTSSKDVIRSQSVRSTKKVNDPRHRHRGSSIPSEVSTTCSGVKVKHRTVSNRSLPLPGDETEYLRLRNFSVTSKGVINRGDSFRSKSSANVRCLMSHVQDSGPDLNSVPVQCHTGEVTRRASSIPTYKVLLIGAPDVGKTSLKNQFMTSEYICAYDGFHDDESDKAVSIILNSEESLLEFEEETLLEETPSLRVTSGPQPDAYVIVYSTANRRSYLQARHLLAQVETNVDTKAIILVGNKTDLARLRTVTTEESRSLAKDRGCKFIETSVAINHQVDELLVGVLTQIRMKAKVVEKHKKKRDSQSRRTSIYSGSKASGVLKKILKRACLKSKSCDNLHVL